MTSRCPTCTGGFSGVLVYKTYKGRHYHTDCLRCTGCGATVGGKSSQPVEFEAEVYCVECAERCASCERPLNGNHMELKGKKYHHECFKCMRCSKPMGPEVYMLDNCPACLKCCEEVFEMRQTEAQGTS